MLSVGLLAIDFIALIAIITSIHSLLLPRVLIGYLFSLLLGHLVTQRWSGIAHEHADSLRCGDERYAVRAAWFPRWTGHIERFVFTTLVAFSVPGAASFFAAWIAVKAAGGWAVFTGNDTTSPYFRAVYVAGLQASAVSALFGLIGGLIIGCKAGI